MSTSLDDYLYFMTTWRMAGLVKIGRSRNPLRRLREARVFCPNVEISNLWLVVGGADAAEITVHGILQDCRVEGEWFEPAPARWVEVRTYLETVGRSVTRQRPQPRGATEIRYTDGNGNIISESEFKERNA